jgi:glycosyltransferase involved in cell wall biosynthesis
MSRTVSPKIVYLLPGGLFNPAGMERTISIKANYLADILHYDVSIITTEQMGRPVFFPLSEKIHLYHLDIGIHAKFGREQYAVKIISRFCKTLQYKRRLARLLQIIRPDITISTLGLDIGFLNNLKDGSIKIGELHFPWNFRTLMAKKLSGGFIPRCVADLRTKELRRKCAGLEKLVVPTHEEETYWANYGNVEVIANPLPFHDDRKAALSNKKVLAAGRLVYEKGFDLLIDAWAIVAKRYPDWELAIYGSGDRESSLLRQIEDYGLQGKVILHEPVDDIRSVYYDSSFFVFPSRCLEALPMVMLEALSAGLPVVAFDAPCGPKDLIRDSENGYLVETGNIPDLAAKIIRLAGSQAQRTAMGKAAKTAASAFRTENIMQRWNNLFTGLMNGNKKRRIVVSGVGLYRGGGLKIMRECLSALSVFAGHTYEIIALVHDERLYTPCPNVRYIAFPEARKSCFHRLYCEYFLFGKLSKRLKPYAWLSMHDITPSVKAGIRAVYYHNAFPFYRPGIRGLFLQGNIFLMCWLSIYIYGINIRKNNYIIVQQEWLRRALRKTFAVGNIVVALPAEETGRAVPEKRIAGRETVFFYPAAAIIQKNFEIICSAAALLEKDGITAFKVILTIGENDNRYAEYIYSTGRALKSLQFVGFLTPEAVHEHYASSDCLLFPSKAETWGLPISEAKAYGKPVFAADLPYAGETVGEYDKTCFFDPDNARQLAELMKNFIHETISYDPTVAVCYEQPVAHNWDELFRILFTGG